MKHLFLLLYFLMVCFFHVWAQSQTYPAEILILNNSLSPIEGAEVRITNSDIKPDWKSSKLTKKDGRAEFLDVPYGKVKIQIKKSGYLPLEEEEKITENGNIWKYELKQIPDEKFYLLGKVTDRNGNLLMNCRVHLRLTDKNFDTLTDQNGRFEFVIDKWKLNTRYELDFQFMGYSPKSISGQLLSQITWLEEDIQLDKNKSKLNPSRLSIGMILEVGIFLSDTKSGEEPINISQGFLAIFQTPLLKNRFYGGVGWHFPLQLKTSNSFVTLTEFESEIETQYQIESWGGILMRYYWSTPSFDGSAYFTPFTGFAALFENQKPEEPIFSEGNFVEKRESFFKVVPRLTLGLAWRSRFFSLETFFAYSYFKLQSQNFQFNYFGRADPMIVENSVHHSSIGLTFLFTIPKK